MSQRLTGRNPLAYLGVEALTPPNMITSPVSPTAESRNANVGDYWLNTTNSNLYILASLSDMVASWVLIHTSLSSISFVTNIGTAVPVGGILNILGGAGITTLGSGNTATISLTVPVSIANGGTNATSMTNSNGVVYFNGTSLVTTTVGTAGQILTSQGVGMPPHFAANTASSTFDADSGSATPSAGVITLHGTGDITSSASGSTVTFTGTGTTAFIADSGTATASINAITISGGTGITTSGSGSIVTINATGAGAFSWHDVPGNSQTMVANNGYVADNAGLCTMTLPATAVFGTTLFVVGNGAGGWKIAQNAGQNIRLGSAGSTTVGVAGSLASTNQYDSIQLLCVVANTTWNAISMDGNITIV